MLVGLYNIGDSAHSSTSKPSGTNKVVPSLVKNSGNKKQENGADDFHRITMGWSNYQMVF
jgi:hypothetical protein